MCNSLRCVQELEDIELWTCVQQRFLLVTFIEQYNQRIKNLCNNAHQTLQELPLLKQGQGYSSVVQGELMQALFLYPTKPHLVRGKLVELSNSEKEKAIKTITNWINCWIDYGQRWNRLLEAMGPRTLAMLPEEMLNSWVERDVKPPKRLDLFGKFIRHFHQEAYLRAKRIREEFTCYNKDVALEYL